MGKRAVAAFMAVSICVAGAFSAATVHAYNVAVLPAWRNWGHVHDFDWILKKNEYTFTNCLNTVEQMDYIVNNIDKYNLLIAPPLFGYLKKADLHLPEDRPYDMAKYAPRIAKWIQDGGCFLGVDMNYPMAMEWYKLMDPKMDVSACVDPARYGEPAAVADLPARLQKYLDIEKKCWNFGPPVVENNDSLLYFPRSVEPGFCWGHMVIPPELQNDSAWKVIATCGHGKGFPTLMIRRWGKGIIVLSATRSYTDELVENIRVNQKFSQFGVTVTECQMADPIPGTNTFEFVCENSSSTAFNGELELTICPRIKNPDKDPNKREDARKPDLVDDPNFKPIVYKQAGSVAAHSTGAFKLDCRIALRGRVHATMKFRTSGTEAVIFERFLTLPELFAVSGPPYRSLVSVARRFKKVTFTTFIYPNEEDISTCSVKLSVRNAASNEVAKADLPAKFGRAFHKVELSQKLPAGQYTIVGQLVKTADGSVIDTAEGSIEIMPNGPAYAAFDEDNTLIVEGEPFLACGIYHPRDKKWDYQGFRDVANVGFNVVNIFGWMGVGKLDILRPVDAYCLWEQLPHRSPVMCMEQAWTLAKHPAALINYTVDEPPESQFSFVNELNKAWRKYDPYHPTFLASYQPHHFERNARISDILAPDPYPYSPEKGDDSDISLVSRRVDLARAASGGVGPVFCVPQSFGCEPPYIWRNMGIQAIVHGAKGLIWYAWNEGRAGPWGGLVWNDELILEAEKFIAQLQSIAPAILGDEENQPRMFAGGTTTTLHSGTIIGGRKDDSGKTEDIDSALGSNYTLHGMVCRDPKKGTRYLLLANTSKEPISFDLPLPEAGEAEELLGAFDDSSIRVVNGIAKIELGKFGSGIWYWDGPRPTIPRPVSDFAVRELPARASGKTLVVGGEGAAYTNLQMAIDAANDGDVIKVAEGDWGRIVCDNKLIDIVAVGERYKTFISGANAGRAATLTQRPRGEMGFETNTLVRGFTIRGGDFTKEVFRPKYGGGVIGGTLVDCVVQGNKGRYGGGAAYANVFNCIFRDNTANLGGGAVSLCNVSDSLLEKNSADFDGGAAEWSKLENCVISGNKAGRLGGGLSNGSATRCRIMNNRSEGEGGGAFRAGISYCIVARNSAKNGAGGLACGASYSTIMYNTIDKDSKGTGASSGCDYCLIGYNTSKANPTAFQIAGYHDRYGTGNWYASNTNDYPKGDWRNPVGVFTASAFVDAQRDNYRLTAKAPFINAGAWDKVVPRCALDVYGNKRMAGGVMDVGAAEFQSGTTVFCNVDATKANPFVGSPVAGAVLKGAYAKPAPAVRDGAIVFAGNGGAETTTLPKDTGAFGGQFSKWRYEVDFRADGTGPVVALDGLKANVEKDGKLLITTIWNNSTNIMQTAKSVRGRDFNNLVIDVDKLGCAKSVLKATLNGTEVPVVQPFAWEGVKPGFTLGAGSIKLGVAGDETFTGEIKSFKATAFVD